MPIFPPAFEDDDDDDPVAADAANAVAKKLAKRAGERTHAMKLFVKDPETEMYVICIKNVVRYELALDHWQRHVFPTEGHGDRGRQATHFDAKTCLRLSRIASSSPKAGQRSGLTRWRRTT